MSSHDVLNILLGRPDDDNTQALFYGVRRELPPESKLMLAMIEQAMSDLQGINRVQAAVNAVERARDWVESHDSSWLFSFINCCEALGLSPSATRKRLLALKPREKTHNRAGKTYRREEHRHPEHGVGCSYCLARMRRAQLVCRAPKCRDSQFATGLCQRHYYGKTRINVVQTRGAYE